MTIALAAVGFINGDITYNKEQIKRIIREHRYKSDLILFGETFLQGFDSLSWKYDVDKEIALSAGDPIIDEIRETAKECSVAVSFGYIEKAEDGLYSSQLTIGKDGVSIDNFRRISIGWKEPVADTNIKRETNFTNSDLKIKNFRLVYAVIFGTMKMSKK